MLSKFPVVTAFFIVLTCATLPLGAQQGVPDPSATLNALDQTARNAVSDISRLRIDKWKVDAGTRKNAQSDGESIQRNMKSALPELITRVRSAPADLNTNFKLYRNLDVLYEVFTRFTESAGAFGTKDEFQTLGKDLDELDSARRAFAERLDTLSSSAQAELDHFRAQARAAQAAAAAAPPPKKILIDDTEPEKKPVAKKKKPAKPATPPATDPNAPAPATPK
jgi:hypothetical protein